MGEAKKAVQQEEMANRAEQDRLRKRFREAEEKVNRSNLLFGDEEFGRSLKKKG